MYAEDIVVYQYLVYNRQEEANQKDAVGSNQRSSQPQNMLCRDDRGVSTFGPRRRQARPIRRAVYARTLYNPNAAPTAANANLQETDTANKEGIASNLPFYRRRLGHVSGRP